MTEGRFMSAGQFMRAAQFTPLAAIHAQSAIHYKKPLDHPVGSSSGVLFIDVGSYLEFRLFGIFFYS